MQLFPHDKLYDFMGVRFWSIGAGLNVSPGAVEAGVRAVSEERDEREDRILGL